MPSSELEGRIPSSALHSWNEMRTARHIDKVKLIAATGAIPPWAPLNNAASAPQGRFRLRELMVLVLVIFHWLFPVGDVKELQLVDELVVELSIPLCLLWVEAPDCVSIFGHGLSNTFAHGSIGRKNCLCCEFLSKELRADGNIRGPSSSRPLPFIPDFRASKSSSISWTAREREAESITSSCFKI
ncbi:hypothetical protein MCOR29_007226 [Pyricularia oryzae]|nr:hypothetical protein MCOR01_000549 [Pyricularia oryzae]KAI6314802.1 hypothetical protein MCOR29_007226 [Pyricularia oryzae]KAI6542947.1 hypothetical protein MCOR05_003478 [Pyricularia oryzae]